jgi:hypothetical protein
MASTTYIVRLSWTLHAARRRACHALVADHRYAPSRAQNGVVEEVAALLGQWLRVYSHSVAFPELALPITLSLKKFVQSHRRSSCPAPAALKRLATIQQKVSVVVSSPLRHESVTGPR